MMIARSEGAAILTLGGAAFGVHEAARLGPVDPRGDGPMSGARPRARHRPARRGRRRATAERAWAPGPRAAKAPPLAPPD